MSLEGQTGCSDDAAQSKERKSQDICFVLNIIYDQELSFG